MKAGGPPCGPQCGAQSEVNTAHGLEAGCSVEGAGRWVDRGTRGDEETGLAGPGGDRRPIGLRSHHYRVVAGVRVDGTPGDLDLVPRKLGDQLPSRDGGAADIGDGELARH